jgi:hypothetical protein
MFLKEIFNIPIHNTFGEEDHVKLFGIGGQLSHNYQSLKHFGSGVFGQSGLDDITFAVMLQVNLVNNGFNEADSALPPFRGRATAVKVKSQVIIIYLVADISLDIREMIAQMNTEIQIILGNQNITLI